MFLLNPASLVFIVFTIFVLTIIFLAGTALGSAYPVSFNYGIVAMWIVFALAIAVVVIILIFLIAAFYFNSVDDSKPVFRTTEIQRIPYPNTA